MKMRIPLNLKFCHEVRHGMQFKYKGRWHRIIGEMNYVYDPKLKVMILVDNLLKNKFDCVPIHNQKNVLKLCLDMVFSEESPKFYKMSDVKIYPPPKGSVRE